MCGDEEDLKRLHTSYHSNHCRVLEQLLADQQLILLLVFLLRMTYDSGMPLSVVCVVTWAQSPI
jgi:hypothetical protein